MRRIVAEMGFWLSPLLRDHPVPVLTEYERTVDLQRLARAHEGDQKRQRAIEVKTHGIQNGGGRSSVYKPLTMEQIREKEARLKESKRAAYQEKRARERGEVAAPATQEPPPAPAVSKPTSKPVKPTPAPTVPPTPKRERPRKPERTPEQIARAQLRRQIAQLSPEERKARRRNRDRETAKQRRAAKLTPEALAERERVRSLSPEEKAARRKEQARAAHVRHYAKVCADPEARAALFDTKRLRQRARARAAGAKPDPSRWKDLPTAKQLREEAIAAEQIETARKR